MCGKIRKVYNFITTYYTVCTQLYKTISKYALGCVGRVVPVETKARKVNRLNSAF